VRINGVRALGAIRHDSDRLNVWETLINITRLRNEKYHVLRYYALWALGELGDARPQVLATLTGIAQRDDEAGIRLQAVKSIRKLATHNARAEAALSQLFKRSKDSDIRLAVVEALADMNSAGTAELASELLAVGDSGEDEREAGGTDDGFYKTRVIYALSKLGGEREIRVILDAARDGSVKNYVETTLEDIDPDVLSDVVGKRLRNETDQRILSVLESLQSRLDEAY
jgi:hypothetical protein